MDSSDETRPADLTAALLAAADWILRTIRSGAILVGGVWALLLLYTMHPAFFFRWWIVPAVAIAVFFIAQGLLLLVRRRENRIADEEWGRAVDGRCPHCSYNLRRVLSERQSSCPACGQWISKANLPCRR